ncbi:MAG TPA: CPBP family intramembrane glutamic endopeptidase [Candidatus Binatia bacterium]|nr:CPBP family intramembrane glutamic endopeptidase [Candidatus Binatia bacterium]
MGTFTEIEPVRVLLYPYLALAFTLMVTVFHHRNLRRGRTELRAFLLYFAAFFLFFLAIPLGLIMLGAADPAAFLRSAGLTVGRAGRGLAFSAAAVPVCLIAAWLGSGDPGLREQYPFAKAACRAPATFMAYEAAYLFFYYLPWEFLYRGLLFLALVPVLGLAPALALQTIVSTIHHFGHPDSEIWAACGAGFIFGLVAWSTGSFLYTTFIHALVGIGNDTFICLRRRPRPREENQ